MLNKEKILILGINGMLGHKVYKVFKNSERYDVVGSMRKNTTCSADLGLGYSDCAETIEENRNVCEDFDILEMDILKMDIKIIKQFIKFIKPSCIINCIGLTKPCINETAPILAIKINALFPHQLSYICYTIGARLIHISTDCVFSGVRGNYTPEDISDAEDLYGRTKYLGEVRGVDHLTVRTSIIGHELGRQTMFVEWLCSRPERMTVKGFTNHIWTGVTTDFLAKVLLNLVENKEMRGLIQLAGEKVSKYDLVEMINKEYSLGLGIERHETKRDCDRSMMNTSGIKVPPLEDMIEDMHRNHRKEK